MESKVDGKYRYVEIGDGHPFVFLHGLMGGLSNFTKVAKILSKHNLKVIIPELPIYKLPILRSNIKSYSKFVYRFIQHKSFDKVTLAGNSMGGHIALYFSRLYQQRVKHLVITGSSGLYESGMGESYPRRGDYQYIKEKAEEVFYDPKIATPELVDEVFRTVNDRSKLIRTLSAAKSAIRHNMTKDLPKLKMPTCIIWGKNDIITPPKVAKDFNHLIPKSDLFFLPKCGHAPMMERPKKFCSILLDWLDKQNKLQAI